jgi:hypothetical protein
MPGTSSTASIRSTVAVSAFGTGIENRCEVTEPDYDPDVCDIGNPDDVELSRNDVVVQIWINRQVVIAVRRSYEAPARLDTEAVLPHHAGNAFVIHDVTALEEFSRYSPISITRELVLDLANKLDEQCIGARRYRLPGPVVVGATRQVNHFAPPSNGAALGPLMIDELSFMLTSCRRGVF